jgi:hypothetical protein
MRLRKPLSVFKSFAAELPNNLKHFDEKKGKAQFCFKKKNKEEDR